MTTAVHTELRFLWLEVTGLCNLACTHCYAGSSPSGTHGRMQLADWRRVLQQASDLGCCSVQFIGGEPTAYPHLCELICHAHELGMQVEVYTNLVSVKPEHWDTFQQERCSLATSFYSHDAGVHAGITGNAASFDRTVRNIKQALHNSIPLRVGLVEMHPEQDIAGTRDFLRDLGVRSIGHDRVRSVGRGTQIVRVDQPEAALCGACTNGKAVVVPSGDVYPCIMARHISTGNVLHSSLDQIIVGPMKKERHRLTQIFQQGKWCEPHDCKPNCEPGDCFPETTCKPNRLCFPDFKEDCEPVKPCEPMKTKCHPDWEDPD